MVSLFIIVVLFRKLKFFLCSAVAEEQVEHELAELDAGDNVEASGECTCSISQVQSSHWTATEVVTAVPDLADTK